MAPHHLDLSREELFALGKHLDRGPLWTMSPRITVRHAISLKGEFRRKLPPYKLPELGSPLWYAMMKINRVSEAGGQAGHRNVGFFGRPRVQERRVCAGGRFDAPSLLLDEGQGDLGHVQVEGLSDATGVGDPRLVSTKDEDAKRS